MSAKIDNYITLFSVVTNNEKTPEEEKQNGVFHTLLNRLVYYPNDMSPEDQNELSRLLRLVIVHYIGTKKLSELSLGKIADEEEQKDCLNVRFNRFKQVKEEFNSFEAWDESFEEKHGVEHGVESKEIYNLQAMRQAIKIGYSAYTFLQMISEMNNKSA
jgi:hypothetical protein